MKVLDHTKLWDYEDFCEQAGFDPLDEPDVTYLDTTTQVGLDDEVRRACDEHRFISVRHGDESDDGRLDVTFGWGIVNVLHRCFIPDERNDDDHDQ